MKLTVLLIVVALVGPTIARANDFPTQARVEYVLRCMDANGRQSYETLYSCVCSIDRIAQEFSYDEFVEAESFVLLKSTAGERGGVFRDPERAKVLSKKYAQVTEKAEESCFVGRRAAMPQ